MNDHRELRSYPRSRPPAGAPERPRPAPATTSGPATKTVSVTTDGSVTAANSVTLKGASLRVSITRGRARIEGEESSASGNSRCPGEFEADSRHPSRFFSRTLDPLSISSPTAQPDEPERGADDGDLVERVLRGDREAFGPLVERYDAAVFALCRRWLDGRDTEAQDIAQDTFVRAYQRLGDLQDPVSILPRGSFKSLDRCVGMPGARHSSRSVRCLRATKSRPSEESRAIPTPRSSIAAWTHWRATSGRLWSSSISIGLSYREIAQRLGLSFAKVDHLIRGARDRLARRLRVRSERT